ncbi:MAG: glycosyltransferase [Rhodospirillales bacterium]|nr:MAG: glycosyltransferase [Rhodospirillales bacterium]
MPPAVDDRDAGTRPPPDIGIVVPMYNERENVGPLVLAVQQAMDGFGRSYQLLLVDDGSSDGTTEAIIAAEQAYPNVQGVFLARNYGQSTALQAGFDTTQAPIVVSLDGDLQNDPADIPWMVETLEKEDLDVLCGWRRNRQDAPVRKAFSWLANRIICRLTHSEMHDFGCTLKVYRRDSLALTRLYGELHRFLPALLGEVGANIKEVSVTHNPRRHGRSKYGLDRTFRVILDVFLIMFLRKYLQRALHLFGGLGLMCLIPGLLIWMYLTSLKFMMGEDIGDRPLLMVGTLLILSGIILIGQGLLGELVGRLVYTAGGRAQYHLKLPRKLHKLREAQTPTSAGEP